MSEQNTPQSEDQLIARAVELEEQITALKDELKATNEQRAQVEQVRLDAEADQRRAAVAEEADAQATQPNGVDSGEAVGFDGP